MSTIPPPIPVRNHITDNTTAITNTNEKSRKPSDQPPELPPKTVRIAATTGKFGSPVNPVVPTTKTNPIVNKENHHGATAESEPITPSNEPNLIQRQKSKSARRKMTEEEAIKELG
jgi:hypothetical protein